MAQYRMPSAREMYLSARLPKPTPAPPSTPSHYSEGFNAGSYFCEESHKGIAVAPPFFHSDDFKRGFYDGKEACEKKYVIKPKFESVEYEAGRSEGATACNYNKKKGWLEAPYDLSYHSARSADWNRGYQDGIRETGC